MNIFVGNLAFNTTDQDIRQLFEPYGVVDTINIITDRYTGQSRGFGFVEMADTRAAQSAIQVTVYGFVLLVVGFLLQWLAALGGVIRVPRL